MAKPRTAAPFLSRLALLPLVAVLLVACGTAGNPDPADLADNSTAIVVNTPIPIRQSPTPTATATSTATATATAIPYSDDWPPELVTVADNLIEAEDGVFGVVILDSDGNVLYSHNSTTPFITASLYKLVLMADIFKRVEFGELSLNQEVTLQPDFFEDGEAGDTYFTAADLGGSAPIRELLLAVGDYSSNVSARSLLQFTNWASLNETARECGMVRTHLMANPAELPEWPPIAGADGSQEDSDTMRAFIEQSFADSGPVNLSTAQDMAAYQLGLIQGTVVSPYVSAQILSILRYQEIRDRIPALLDDQFTTANKPGNLVHAVHDVGVIFTPGEPRVLAAMSGAVVWDGRAHELIQRLALIAVGRTNIPPISDRAMEDGGGMQVVFGPPQDPNAVIADPEALLGTRTPTPPANEGTAEGE